MEIYKEVKKDLLEKFRSIFGGDIVEKVYVMTYENISYPEKKKIIMGDLNTNERRLYPDDEGAIDNGAQDIIIKFKGGSEVLFTNSEWGTIRKTDLTSDDYRSI